MTAPQIPGQMGIVPDSAAAVEDARAAAAAELERLDMAALQYRAAALDDLHRAATENAAAAVELDNAVAAARGAGATWQQIGDAVGLTRQSAHERWAGRA